MPATLASHERARLKADPHDRFSRMRAGPRRTTELASALIKVSVQVDDRDDRRALGDPLTERVSCVAAHSRAERSHPRGA
jgi:hypothetical protein